MSLAGALDRPVLTGLRSPVSTADGGAAVTTARTTATAPVDPAPRVVRVVAAATVVASVAFPLNEVLVLAFLPGGTASVPAALLVAGVLIPLVVRHVRSGLSGDRPAHAWWTVAAMALVIGTAVLLDGSGTLSMLPAPVVAAMLLLRLDRAVVVLVLVAALTVPVALALDDGFALWYPVAVLWRSVTLYVLVRLVATVRELHRARSELAERAVTREQQRIDEELRRTIGVALADLAASGARVQRTAVASGSTAASGPVPAELPELAAASRRTLAQARALIGRYRCPSFDVELRAAATLMGAAGIPVRLVHPADGFGSPALRAELRTVTTGLLLDGDRSAVVLEATADGRLVVHRDQDRATDPVPAEVPR